MAKRDRSKETLILTRSDVAKILNCSSLTIANREKSGKYPMPLRNTGNGYRCYGLADIFELQVITYGHVAVAPILTIGYDRGFTDVQSLNDQVTKALDIYRAYLIERSQQKLQAGLQ
jgi:DNA-binding transcriptional MerR regulator